MTTNGIALMTVDMRSKWPKAAMYDMYDSDWLPSVFFSGVQRLFLVLSETDWLKDPLKDIARNKLQESEKVCKYYKNKEILCVAPSVRGSSAHLDSSSVHTDFWVQTTLQNACRDDPLTYTSINLSSISIHILYRFTTPRRNPISWNGIDMNRNSASSMHHGEQDPCRKLIIMDDHYDQYHHVFSNNEKEILPHWHFDILQPTMRSSHMP